MAVSTPPGTLDWEEVYDSYFPLLFRYSLRFTPDRDLIKDLLQDFFIELYLKRGKLAGIRNIRSYLMVAVRRKVVRKLSEDSKNHLVPLAEEDHDFILELSPESKLIESQLLESRFRYLSKAVARLTKRQKEAVYLRFYENMSYEEIAAIMSMKEVKYARTLVYRAISEMKVELHKAGGLLCFLLFLSGDSPSTG